MAHSIPTYKASLARSLGGTALSPGRSVCAMWGKLHVSDCAVSQVVEGRSGYGHPSGTAGIRSWTFHAEWRTAWQSTLLKSGSKIE